MWMAIAAASGTLSITSDPAGATVYVDGQVAGVTPFNTTVAEGDHRVRLVKDGFLENGRIVSVDGGKTATLQVRLTARPASDTASPQDQGSGISSGPPPNYKKWIYIGAAGAGGAAAGGYFALRNRAPVLTGVNAIPANGLQNGTSIAFSGQALKDPDGDSLTYAWEFGDGGTETSATPTHVYTTTGTFAPKLTVSDGKHTVTASTSVTIKSLTGTWTGQVPAGNPAFVTGTFVLTQSGTSISGTYSDQFGPGTIASGTVRTTTPIVTMTINQQGFTPFVFTGTPGPDVNTIAGVLNESGFNNAALTITRR